MLTRLRSARRPSAPTRRPELPHLPAKSSRAIETLESRTLFNATYFDLSSGNFSQNWSDTSALAANDWSNVPNIVGYQGNGVTPTPTSTDPQTCTNDDISFISAIKGSTATATAGGIHEIANDVIAMKGSGSAAGPYLRLHLNSVGRENLNISYTLRELEDKTVDQKFALQYRLGGTGTWTNIPAGAVNGVFNAAGQQNATVNVALPAALNNQSQLQLRILGHDAPTADAMVGVDDIVVTSTQVAASVMSFDSASVSQTIGESGGQVHLTVTRGPITTGTVSVDWATVNGSATAGSDFTGASGTLTFNDGETSKQIDIDILPDAVQESTQSFTVALSNPQGAAALVGTGTATIVITDDDRPTGGKLLSAGPLTQNWSDTNLITTDNDWSGVPYITGYRGDDLTTATGTDPQGIVADGTNTPVNVNANRDDVYLGLNVSGGGGLAEIDTNVPNPAVTINGSGTADAPFLLMEVDTTGVNSVDVSYNLRDMDPSSDNAVQQVALQYRVGNTGNFTNVPAAYVLDATEQSLATKVTPVAVTINDPAIANQSLVQFRVMTTNAANNDEYVGVDDIVIKQTPAAGLPAWVAPDSAATWNGSTLTVTGAATIVADPGADNPTIEADGAAAMVTINPTSDRIIHVAGISLTNGAKAAVTSIGAGTSDATQRVLVVGAGGITITGGGLDLADNAIILKGMASSAVQTLIATGYNAGQWNGTGGITSSTAATEPTHATALGYASNGVLNKTSFDGVTGLATTDVLVKYTYGGDANLDAKVDIGDLGLLAGAWQQSGKTWFDGDFTYNGTVDIGDLGLLAGNWQMGV
jgi:hypothetical protein